MNGRYVMLQPSLNARIVMFNWHAEEVADLLQKTNPGAFVQLTAGRLKNCWSLVFRLILNNSCNLNFDIDTLLINMVVISRRLRRELSRSLREKNVNPFNYQF